MSRIMRLFKQHWRGEYPPVLIAAWIREYRNSETIVQLDDLVTPGIRRTRYVPQGDPGAADLFGAALGRQRGNS